METGSQLTASSATQSGLPQPTCPFDDTSVASFATAGITAGPNELILTPHLKPTQQGLDTIKIGVDPSARNITRVVVYEQKCTEHARDQFRDEVIPAFHEWKSHKRDNQLVGGY